jgi:hypothetical protein
MFFIEPDKPTSLTVSLLKNLLIFPGDILMLLHTGIFAEMVNKRRYSKNTLKDMLGFTDNEVDALYQKTSNPQTLEKIYVQRFEEIIKNITINKVMSGSNRRNVIKKVDIRTKSANYVLLYATRSTGGKDPYAT